MGSLVSAAAPRLRCPEEANVRAPDTVVSVHLSFINAGAELIETNTFGANRRKLAARYLEDEFARDQRGRRQARPGRAAGLRQGDLHRRVRSGRSASTRRRGRRTAAPLFAEQAELLAGRGVDLFAIETFFDLDELVTAIEAVRSVSSLPIVAMMTFGEDAETIGGVPAADAAERLAALGVAAIGTNHGAGPNSALIGPPGDGRVAAARRDAEHRPRQHVGRADHLPARRAGLLRRVRRSRARASAPS